ncbi:hypothetical protein QAD02_016747 [Eretmocerus hayati]|uniref:Uncharacterized protein n=1 Tax=Eretmocerus hayati TaxID=131215 RepID=A0ACC2PC28_9HYME|nr:hypothetical protein QAD02_016747 [Eretmocerus hayati]
MKNLNSRRYGKSLYDVVRPAFYLIRLFGLAPYSLSHGVGMAGQKSSEFLPAYFLIPLFIHTYLIRNILCLFRIPENFNISLGTDPDSKWSKFFVTCFALIFSRASLLPVSFKNISRPLAP